VNELIEETYFNMLKKERKKSKVAKRFAVTPKRGKNHKAPKNAGERHGKFLVFSRFLTTEDTESTEEGDCEG
jgi:hypothetical protein